MAGNLTLALRTAQSGLLASQGALDALTNNIANVNTPGYSKKVINLEQRVVSGSGAGVQLSDITRQVDEGLLKTLRRETATLEKLDTMQSYYDRVQDLFGTPEKNSSIAHIMSEFTAAVESLALSPDRTIEQSEVVRWGEEIGAELDEMSDMVQDLRLQADRAIGDMVDRVNELASQIEDLNNKIIRNETISGDVTDLKDKRDMALDELSGYMDIVYFERNQGDVVVFTGGGTVLVDNTAQTVYHTATTQMTALNTYEEGHFNGITVGSTSANDITSNLQNGAIKGLIDLRDNVLTGIQAQLDEFATELRDQYNLVHNRGTPYPGLQSAEGTRTFIDTGGVAAPDGATDQTITLSGGDVTIAVFNATGDQQAVTTLGTIMDSATFGYDAANSTGPWTMAAVAQTIEDWLQDSANGGPGLSTAAVSITSDGKFSVELNNSSNYLAFRDETATANGSTASDVTVQYDSNGDGTVDEHVSGFSNFLGLNDFFVDGLEKTAYDSETKSSGYTFTPTANITLTFRDAGNTETVTLTNGTSYSLSDLATQINDNTTFVTATVIQDGSGYRLRVVNDNNDTLVIADDQGVGASNSFMEGMALEGSRARSSNFLNVRSEIRSNSALMSVGTPQWDADKNAAGEYYMAAGDATIVQELAEVLTSNTTFEASGGLPNQTKNFHEYASAIISQAASDSSNNAGDRDTQLALKNSLELKSNNFRGVNLDEEMSDLILYQEAFSAAARIISVVQKMFDALERAVG